VWCVVGLGNPGRRYKLSRHNAGFLVVRSIQDSLPRARKKRTKIYEVRTCYLEGSELLLVRPLTFMNESGKAVGEVRRKFEIDLSELLVVCDDTSLPLGRLRFRKTGSSGGHKGLQSIMEALGTQGFARLRVGIGAPLPEESLEEYVLSKPRREELEEFRLAISAAAEAALVSLRRGIDFAMNEFN
jgi:PTH1 family peptidyl-tRNA hydrolase